MENVCIECGSAHCAASLLVPLGGRYKRISDVDAESEAAAERTKRMLYHCGVQGCRVLFLMLNSVHDLYSETYTCAGTQSERQRERDG